MSYEIGGVTKLERLINDRIYIDVLEVYCDANINHLLQHLTNLTELYFMSGCDYSVNLSQFSNLEILSFKYDCSEKVDLLKLSNLTLLQLGRQFKNEIILPKQTLKKCKIIFIPDDE